MPIIVLETHIAAAAQICFDLMRDRRLHTGTTVNTNEKAVAGVTEGMIRLGQRVTFEGTHFGIRQRLTVKVVEVERPHRFVDEMTEGAFRSFRHVHEFTDEHGGTLMRDTVIWETRFGLLGAIADKILIERHLRNLVSMRNFRLKGIAEAGC